MTSPPRPRIAFMGTPPFAVPIFEACFDVGEVVVAITQPDRPKGRGNPLAPPAVKEAALARGVPVLQPTKIRGTGFAQSLKDYRPDVSVVAAYGKILPKEVLEAPVQGSVNVHASLLPRFRGAAPIQWAIASGDTKTGVTLMQMDEGLDTGPILAQLELPLTASDTSESVHRSLSELGAQAIRLHLPGYLAGAISPVPQPAQGVVLAPILSKEEGELNFSRRADELERRVRAFHPWPGTYVPFEGRRLKVLRAALTAQARSEPPGTVVAAGPAGIDVACMEGALRLVEVQPEGKRPMAAAQFLSGHPLKPGARPFR